MISLRQTFRSLLRTPGVTAIAVLSLAFGIGANAAIFSIFEQLILRPLPVEAPERLVNLRDPGPKMGSLSSTNSGGSASVFSYPMFRDLENADTGFSHLAAHVSFGANLAYEGQTSSSQGALVSGSYFQTLGLQPAAGRLISAADDVTPGDHQVAVLSHLYWSNRFNADDGVVGENLTINGLPMTVIGVAPKGFLGTSLGVNPEVFVPLTMRGQMLPGWEGFENRMSYWVYLFGRLKPGLGIEEAMAAVNVPFQSIIQGVEVPLQNGMSERSLERFKAKTIVLDPGQHGQSSLHQDTQKPLLLLLGVTGFVLLIACANIANLLLIRANSRAGEIAVRLSIGARRGDIVKQLMVESFVLAVAGSVLGLAVAQATLKFLAALLPPASGPAFDFTLGPAVWLFTALLTVLTGLVGLFPALRGTRDDLTVTLKSQGGKSSATRGSRRVHTIMATGQIALATALLISAGLFTRSLLNASRVDLGIAVDRLATFAISPELNGYTPEQSRNLFERLETDLLTLPGVKSATASMVPLVDGSNWTSNVSVQGFDAGPDTDTRTQYNMVGNDFFHALGITVHGGREFTELDHLDAPKVAVVNEAFARKFGLEGDVIGKRMQFGQGTELDIEIVGLVADSAYSEVKETSQPVVYTPYRQDNQLGAITFYVRTANPEGVLPSLRQRVAGLDPNLPVESLRTMRVQVEQNLLLDRVLSSLSASFALLATLLAAIGLYGVLAYSVSERRREIGLRMALGADAIKVRGMVMAQVGWMTLIGATLGLGAALALGRIASSLLYGLEAHDPAVLGVAMVFLGLVSFGAAFFPARRAAGIDPMRVLREE